MTRGMFDSTFREREVDISKTKTKSRPRKVEDLMDLDDAAFGNAQLGRAVTRSVLDLNGGGRARRERRLLQGDSAHFGRIAGPHRLCLVRDDAPRLFPTLWKRRKRTVVPASGAQYSLSL